MNILVLGLGNTTVSVLLEAILNHEGGRRVGAWSAGTDPAGRVHPLTLRLLADRGIDTTGARSKPLAEFTEPEAPRMDLVISVCAGADDCLPAGLRGTPVVVAWHMPDPGAADPAAQPAAFAAAFDRLTRQALALLALPLETLATTDLQREAARIGRD